MTYRAGRRKPGVMRASPRPLGAVRAGRRAIYQVQIRQAILVVLLEEKDGQPPMPLPPDRPVKIHGCEIFRSQPQSGGSSTSLTSLLGCPDNEKFFCRWWTHQHGLIRSVSWRQPVLLLPG